MYCSSGINTDELYFLIKYFRREHKNTRVHVYVLEFVGSMYVNI